MSLRVNESVIIIEGRMQKICVVVNDYGKLRLRDIPFSFSVVPHSVNAGRLSIHLCVHCTLILIMNYYVIKGDYNITNVPTVIPVGVLEACFQLVAIDDTIVESDEGFTLVIEAANPNDEVIENATVIIVDNDRM